MLYTIDGVEFRFASIDYPNGDVLWVQPNLMTSTQCVVLANTSFQERRGCCTNMDWHEATALAAKLAQLTGLAIRLLTESEWDDVYKLEDRIESGYLAEWTSTEDGLYRVSRGGYWIGSARNGRSAVRFRNEPGLRSVSLGLRVAFRLSALEQLAEIRKEV